MQTNQKLIFALLISILIFMGSYSYFNVFPYYLSAQDSIDPNNLISEFDSSDTLGTFHGKTVQAPTIKENSQAMVLGKEIADGGLDEKDLYPSNKNEDSSNNMRMKIDVEIEEVEPEKRIEVDLTNQRIMAFEGEEKVYDYLISTGKWGRTPRGIFHIWTKLRSTKMSGGSRALGTYYYLPNVEFTMFFSNNEIPMSRGYGIHGTYWHNNFGTPMSHGCINMKTEEVEHLYYWANPELGEAESKRATKDNPGTKIVIFGEAPDT